MDKIYLSINGTCLDLTLSELIDIKIALERYAGSMAKLNHFERSLDLVTLHDKIDSFGDRHLLSS